MNQQPAEVTAMFTWLRKIWAERAALDILNLAWSIQREHAYRNSKPSINQILGGVGETAKELAKAHQEVKEILMEGDDTDDKDIIKSIKD